MIVYLDTSVVLRVLLGQPEPVTCWGQWEEACASVLLKTEFLRTLDRLRLSGMIDDEDRARLRVDFGIVWSTLHVVPVDELVLERAADPFPTPIGTLDAIHLVSAMRAREAFGREVVLLTHDLQLSRAARASGIRVGT